MKLRQNATTHLKTKLSATLKSWLPILQSGVDELEDTLGNLAKENPYIEVKSGISSDFSAQKTPKKPRERSKAGIESLDAIALSQPSLEDTLYSQISPPLFPTPTSSAIAFKIIENLNEEGYFVGNYEEIQKSLEEEGICASSAQIESIRTRFAYLDPPGIGALNVNESFLFQLNNADLPPKIHDLAVQILQDLDQHKKFATKLHYQEAMRCIQSFKNPPALDYYEESQVIIPDIILLQENNHIEVKINAEYYPSIQFEKPPQLQSRSKKVEKIELEESYTQPTQPISKESLEFIRTKAKEARDLVDALEMRKATLHKIGLMIVEYQYEFFTGGEIRPMRLKQLAEEFGHSPSTISRAIANKYLECNRGIFPLKSFFTTALDEETSNVSIKDYIAEIVKNENRKKPLSDLKILQMIEERFGIKIVRRTISKYRYQLNIASSSERKKLYAISVD